MAKDVSLGGFLLTREEWESLDKDERLMLIHAAVEPGRVQTPDLQDSYYEYYESYEVIAEEKLAS